jgi:cobalt/nickel transport system permease protein
MRGIDTLLQEVRAHDALRARSTWLSQLDPRATLLATLAFIVVVVSIDRYAVAALLPLAVFPMVMARLAELSLRRVGAKVLLAMPFALMVGLFNPLFDPAPRLQWWGYPIAGGWLSFLSILERVALTVSAAVILVDGLGMHKFCAALKQLGVPAVLTTQLLFLHRYIQVLAGELQRMNLARELRSGPANTMPFSVYASLLGHLLLRTLERAQRIHQAMLSRGFDGQLPLRQPQPWRTMDTMFIATCLLMFLLLRTTDLTTLLGRLILRVAL